MYFLGSTIIMLVALWCAYIASPIALVFAGAFGLVALLLPRELGFKRRGKGDN